MDISLDRTVKTDITNASWIGNKEERYRGREFLLGTIETACPLEVGWIANVPLEIGALPLDTREHERHRREKH